MSAPGPSERLKKKHSIDTNKSKSPREMISGEWFKTKKMYIIETTLSFGERKG